MSYGYVGRYSVDLTLTGQDLESEVENALEYATREGYDDGLAEARYEYEDRLNEHDAPFNELVDVLTRVHDEEHSDRWPLRQCDRPECQLVTRYQQLSY